MKVPLIDFLQVEMLYYFKIAFVQARATPRNCGPPRPPVKSAPPVSRIFPHRPVERAQVVSFRSDEGSRCILF